jgi:hypothetical protein
MHQRDDAPRRHLSLVTGDSTPAPKPRARPKQHPQGVWDVPAAVGHRRIMAIDGDGNLAIELNLTERIPEPIRDELRWAVERALEQSLRALKV